MHSKTKIDVLGGDRAKRALYRRARPVRLRLCIPEPATMVRFMFRPASARQRSRAASYSARLRSNLATASIRTSPTISCDGSRGSP